jgi:hypothetical protein
VKKTTELTQRREGAKKRKGKFLCLLGDPSRLGILA